MSRRPNIVPSVMLNLALPQPVHTQLTLHLFSELEGRVPLGAYQRFFSERINEFFRHRRLDLAPWANTDPGAFMVSGSPETLKVLERTLKGELPT